ncbi:N-acetyltransferase 10 [Malassezia cuniculi]|uniref:RNA cytidine acetyltransferase n=1 Tax=Malassezia cuniculi TaxID=948313 RepID=A0AAF0EQS1_9BASI|nr:N-acetyltransferase 10 [Malassezia cuniculi]
MRKQLDPRIPTLIRNSVATGHRSFFVLVGDHGRDQVVNLHFLLTQSRVEARPNVLWCYKKDLGFTTHRRKREAKIKRDIKRGVRDQDTQDPFELFVGVTDIRYCYYKDTPKILGRTFGMLVLQDFEAITPNTLARTIETVQGGGIVVLLLQTMTSLRQLYSLSMDVHARYRSASSDEEPVARFNERFLLSLSASPNCLLLDDELNVLPLSKGQDIRPLPETATGQSVGGVGSAVRESNARKERNSELAALQEDVAETRVVGQVVKHCKTLDQARAVLTILDVLASTTLNTTVTLTAGRGRGKSAALGLCLAAAVAHGYSNMFVTSPSPENLKTLFEFLLKGLDVLGYEEVADWDIQRGTGDWKDVVLRVNIFRGHRQTIQYIEPQDYKVLGQAELVVIDEAAAIPLPLVRNLIGPYLVFLSSTVNGYEGTGRSLSLKLFSQLRDSAARGGSDASGRALREVELSEPIRYAEGDPVEAWLNKLLCLDATITPAVKGCPHPSACELFMVNRDTLFSYHPTSEAFLQRMMALYVASHYKNSPNDLQLMSDAPAHHLFVLLAPISGSLPEPLCVIQVALEGNISRQAILNSLARGTRDAGDLIPWLITQQFQDSDFASLSGARIVRIAAHPEYAGMGYGTRALELLEQFYRGSLLDADAVVAREQRLATSDKKEMPPLLERLSERTPESLEWLGVSYGLTPSLLRFWKRAGYAPLYVRQKPNELTGEHSTIQLKTIAGDSSWLAAFAGDFRRRFMSLLSFKFMELGTLTAISVLEGASNAAGTHPVPPITAEEVHMLLTPFDLKRLESYGSNLIELQVVVDLLPVIASLYFSRRIRVADDDTELTVSGVSAALLLATGLQHRTLEDVAGELQIVVSQAHALLSKAIRWIVKNIRAVERSAIAQDIEDEPARPKLQPLAQSLEDELAEAGKVAVAETLRKPKLTGKLAGDEDDDAQDADEDDTQDDDDTPTTAADNTAALHDIIVNDSEMKKYIIDDSADGAQDWSEAEARVRKMTEKPGKNYSSTFSIRKKADKTEEAPRAPKRKDSTAHKGSKRKLSRAAK